MARQSGMRVCKHCGEVSGRFFNRHGECKKRHASALEELLERSTRCALGRTSIEGVHEARALASQNFVTESEIRDALIGGFEQAVDIVLGLDYDWSFEDEEEDESAWDDDYIDEGTTEEGTQVALGDAVISEDEERHLNTYMKNLGLSESELDRNGACRKIYLGARLREISYGQMPYRLWQSKVDDLPFRLQESEKCVWIFWGVNLETKSTNDRGLLALTNKRLYFVGNSERHRISYGRIFNLSREWNGFSVNQGSATKSYTFENGWFAWRLLSELVKKD